MIGVFAILFNYCVYSKLYVQYIHYCDRRIQTLVCIVLWYSVIYNRSDIIKI